MISFSYLTTYYWYTYIKGADLLQETSATDVMQAHHIRSRTDGG